MRSGRGGLIRDASKIKCNLTRMCSLRRDRERWVEPRPAGPSHMSRRNLVLIFIDWRTPRAFKQPFMIPFESLLWVL